MSFATLSMGIALGDHVDDGMDPAGCGFRIAEDLPAKRRVKLRPDPGNMH